MRLDIAWYRGFWDVPRLFSVRIDGGYLLFDCPFDDVLDDYRPDFSVAFVESESELTDDATIAAAETSRSLGTVPKSELTFDETRRRFVEVPDGLIERRLRG